MGFIFITTETLHTFYQAGTHGFENEPDLK